MPAYYWSADGDDWVVSMEETEAEAAGRVAAVWGREGGVILYTIVMYSHTSQCGQIQLVLHEKSHLYHQLINIHLVWQEWYSLK